jgi:trigger factor
MALKTEIERLDATHVKLLIDVSEEEFDADLRAAARDLASRVKLKGFRRGKAPLPVLEAHLGKEAIQEIAIENALPRYLQTAIEEADLDPVGSPEVDNVDTSSGLSFEAKLTVLPKVEISDWKGLELDVPALEVADSEIDEKIEEFRKRLAPLEPVGRPARKGDFLLIDLRGEIHGEEVPGASLTDFSYELGSASLLPKLDETLEGARPGDILKFNDRVPVRPQPTKDTGTEDTGREATFTVIVKEVRERRPEPLTDEWVENNTEWDTIEEMRQGVRERLAALKKAVARQEAQRQALQKLAEKVTADIPEEAIRSEVESYASDFEAALKAAGQDVEQYLRNEGLQRADMELEWRKQAQRRIKADLALEAIARQENLKATDEEIAREAEIYVSSLRAPEAEKKKLRSQLIKGRAAARMAAGIIKSKALKKVLEHAVICPAGDGKLSWEEIVEPEETKFESGFRPGSGESPSESASESPSEAPLEAAGEETGSAQSPESPAVSKEPGAGENQNGQ